jgi:hypothetical protein
MIGMDSLQKVAKIPRQARLSVAVLLFRNHDRRMMPCTTLQIHVSRALMRMDYLENVANVRPHDRITLIMPRGRNRLARAMQTLRMLLSRATIRMDYLQDVAKVPPEDRLSVAILLFRNHHRRMMVTTRMQIHMSR